MIVFCDPRSSFSTAMLTHGRHRLFHNLKFDSSRIDQKGYERLQNCCAGWLAQYTIWKMIKPPIRIAEYHIKVKPSEIELQMLQSLKPLQRWLQFPMSISPDLITISVLRTIYRSTLSEGGRTIHATMKSARLPLNLDASLSNCWNAEDKLARAQNCSSWGDAKDSSTQQNSIVSFGQGQYIYWTAFSPSSDMILFVDQEPGRLQRVVLFRIKQTASSSLELNLIASQQVEDHKMPGDKRFRVSFHPRHPILALGLGSRIFVWCYTKGKSTHSILQSRLFTD
jgi:hypothetical protein